MKAELHAHINGSLRDASILELAKESDIVITNPHVFGRGERSLSDCFSLFGLIHQVVDRTERVSRLTAEVVTDFANDGVEYLELRSTPRTGGIDLTPQTHVAAIKEGIELACSQLAKPPTVRLILSIDRRMSEEQAYAVVDLALTMPGFIVGVDLSGNPALGTASTFFGPLTKAYEAGLGLSMHFAEVENQQETESIIAFAEQMTAKDISNTVRLAHGCYLGPKAWEMLKSLGHGHVNSDKQKCEFCSILPKAEAREGRVCLEVCLSSNLYTDSVKKVGDLSTHHLPEVFEAGIQVALCTDDSGVFATTLSKEYDLFRQHFQPCEDCASIVENTAMLWTFDKTA